MSPEFESVFVRLREIVRKHAGTLAVKADTPASYSLHAPVGPTTLKAWRGEVRSPTIPVAWVQIGKAYVSYHLMGLYGNDKLRSSLSPELKRRMQGKTCFNFKTHDEALFEELDRITDRAITEFRKAGFIAV